MILLYSRKGLFFLSTALGNYIAFLIIERCIFKDSQSITNLGLVSS